MKQEMLPAITCGHRAVRYGLVVACERASLHDGFHELTFAHIAGVPQVLRWNDAGGLLLRTGKGEQ